MFAYRVLCPSNACILLSLLFALSCSNQSTSPDVIHPQVKFNSEKLSHLLTGAYEQNSQALLDSFFIAWQQMLPSFTPQMLSSCSDTVNEAYKVFTTYYSPTNLSRLSGGSHENFETDFRYIVIQNDLHISLVDTNPQFHYYDGVKHYDVHLDDFRPTPEISGHPFVYLSPQADSIIFHFLFNEDSTSRDDHNNRLEFLRQAMQLTHHHWFADYHKATMPYAFTIIFNNSINQALVNFRIFYQFGEAYLEKKNSSWMLINSRLTAIE